MDWTLEVVIVPVSDIDRAVAFYRDKVGFDLDHDTKTEPRCTPCSSRRGAKAARSGSGTSPPNTH